MTTPLPTLLRRAQDALSGIPVADAEVAPTLSLLMAEIASHPALAPALAEPPAPAPTTPPVSAVALARVICEIANEGKPLRRSEGQMYWHTNCIAVQRLIFIAHGYNLAWYGEPLVDEEFERFGYGPSLPSLRALPGWKFSAEEAEGVLTADTSAVSARQRAVVKAIVDAHGTWGKMIDERMENWPIVVDGDYSTPAIHAYFLSQIAQKELKALKNRTGTSAKADAVEAMIDEDTRTELLRRWLTAG